MKFVFILGGASGFLAAAGTDYLSGRNPDRILLDGAVGCLVGGLLMRWFWNVLLRGVRETYLARQQPAAIPAAGPRAPAAPVKPRI